MPKRPIKIIADVKRPTVRERRILFSMRLPQNLLDAAKKAAEMNDLTFTSLVEEALWDWLKHHDA